jgi:hypothetical protein
MSIENAANIQPGDHPTCRCCGSPNIIWVEFYGPTGVIAPDGGAEYRAEGGVRCRDCGAIEDEPEAIRALIDLKAALPSWGSESPTNRRSRPGRPPNRGVAPAYQPWPTKEGKWHPGRQARREGIGYVAWIAGAEHLPRERDGRGLSRSFFGDSSYGRILSCCCEGRR